MLLERIRIVLSHPSHPGNVGSVARAMKTMGISDLVLVSPKDFPSPIANELASGADDILQKAKIVSNLAEALAGCTTVFVSSSRKRDLPLSVIYPQEAAALVAKQSHEAQIAFVMGCEKFGLTNEEMLQGHYQLLIETDSDFRSLNLAQALQIIVYLCRVHILSAPQDKIVYQDLAQHEEIEGLYQHAQRVLEHIDFYDPKNPKRLFFRLRRLFARTRLEKPEVNILRGILGAIDKYKTPVQNPRSLPIYLDYMATTPLDPRVLSKMQSVLNDPCAFANSGSESHFYGRYAALLIQEARNKISQALSVQNNSLIWTSGATEANNLAILGAARFYKRKGLHIITSKTEHPSVIGPCQQLEKEGFSVTYLNPRSDGLIYPEDLANALRQDTILCSFMHVNNEIGVIQDLAAFSRILKPKGILFHADGAQALGKVEIDLEKLGVDLYALSAHKAYGPKGVGALFVRETPRIHLNPILFGGGQEGGLRSGTLPTHQIVGMAEAVYLAQTECQKDASRLLALRNRLWTQIQDLGGIHLNGDFEKRVPGNLNFFVEGVDPNALLYALSYLALSQGSACHSSRLEPSPVLLALGLSPVLAKSALRLTLGRFTTEIEVDRAILEIKTAVKRLRRMAP